LVRRDGDEEEAIRRGERMNRLLYKQGNEFTIIEDCEGSFSNGSED
jgi:hypothetical protein